MNMEEVETKDAGCVLECEKEMNKCRCDELEENSKNAEARVVELEQEIEKRKTDYEELVAKFRELEAQNKSARVELVAFRKGNNEIRGHGNSVVQKSNVGCGGGKEEDVVVDLTREGDGENVIDQLMIENRVLDCEKGVAENEVVVLKEKLKELELWVSQMDFSRTIRGGKPLLDDVVIGENRPGVKSNTVKLLANEKSVDGLGAIGSVPCNTINASPASGTPYKDSPCSHTPSAGKEGVCSKLEEKYHRKVKRHLSFDGKRSLSKKISPSTPGISTSANSNVINIFDSDDESDTHGTPLSISNDQGTRKVCMPTEYVLAETSDSKKYGICLEDYKEDVNEDSDKVPCGLTSKRKRIAKIVTSDTESDEDDNVPISKLKKMNNLEMISGVANYDVNGCKSSSSPVNGNFQCAFSRSRRSLVSLRQCEEKVKAERISSNMTSELKQEQKISMTEDADGESEEAQSESEGESLSRFIVDSSDASDASSAHNVPGHSESESDSFDEILCKLQRTKDRKCIWEFEADMLSAFGKDLELCMRAVCALYRQQTSDEQVSRETKYENRRGFSKFDALRGTNLAVFLTGGDPEGNLKKSKLQLEEYGSSAVELCKTLATRYSKQLFEIYKNKEDPFFLPC